MYNCIFTAAFKALLVKKLYDLGCVTSKGDPDVLMRTCINADCFEYWEYILCCIDDKICVSHDPKRTLKGLEKSFKLKDKQIEEPQMYLGAELSKIQSDGVE